MPWPKHLSCPVEAVAMTPNTSAPAKVNGERRPQPLYSWTVLHTPLLTLINTSMSHHNPPRESVGPHVKPADSRASGALVAQKLVMCSLEFFYSYWILMLGSADSRPDKGNSSKSPSRLGYKENGDFAHLAWFIKSLQYLLFIIFRSFWAIPITSWVAQPLVWHVIKPSLLHIPKMEHTKNWFQPQKTKKPTKPTETSLAKRLAELLWILP